MAAAAGLFDNVTVTTVSATYVNSALNIAATISGISIFIYFMLPSIIGASINKDFKYNVHHILYAYPIKKSDYLFAKFLSSFLVVLIILSFVLIAIYLGTIFPFTNPDLKGEFDIMNYVQPFFYLVIPNFLFFGAIVYTVVTFARNIFAGFIVVLILLVLQNFTGILVSYEEYKVLGALIDPLGFAAIQVDTEYWTVFEQNNNYLPYDGYLLKNRLIWLGVSLLIFAGLFFKFNFNQQAVSFNVFKKTGKKLVKSNFDFFFNIKIPKLKKDYSFKTIFNFAFKQSFFDFKYILTNKIFIGFALLLILIALSALSVGRQIQGTTTYPVTREMAQIAIGITSAFMTIMTFLFAGMLINRAKIYRMDQLVNATPFPNWAFTFSKFLAMFWIQAFLFVMLILVAISVQLYNGYFKLEIDHYLFTAFCVNYLTVMVWTMLAFFVHQIFKNYILGFIVLLAFLILLGFFPDFGIEQSIFRFNNRSGAGYSDMVGWSDSISEFYVYRLYWFSLGVVLYVLSLQFYRRVEQYTAKQRIKKAFSNIYSPRLIAMLVGFVTFIGLGSWIYYNDNILNERYSGIEREKQQVEYENTYSKYASLPSPRLTDVSIEMDINPEKRDYKAKGVFKFKNKTTQPIDSVILKTNDDLRGYTFSKTGKVVLKDSFYDVEVYHFDKQFMPGDSLTFTFEMENEPNTILNINSSIKSNGTFLNYGMFPSIGYYEFYEISNNKLREKYDLPPKERMKSPYDSTALRNNYISNSADWINFEAKLSTSSDQIAIAPGYLVEEKSENGRNYYHYKMDKPILNFYNIMSAKYEVYEEDHNGTKLQIFYHKPHDFNIERMAKGMKASLDYYEENFSPYQFRQLRIMEFPRTNGSFAQSFANTVPFSESVGFIAKVDEEDKDAVDYPFGITSHEVAHQWWAHQVISADVRGATLLSESLSEYSSLKVLEQEYGSYQMRRFLKDALDKYLKGRSFEQQKELPLMLNENQQYIHYNKGSLVLYAMSDYLGDKKFNAFLSKFIKKNAFQEPPYTTAVEFVNELEEVVPDTLNYLVEDMFKSITLYDNYIEKASYQINADSTYTVDIEAVVSKYKSNEKGKKLYSMGNDSLMYVVEKDTLKSWPLKDYIEIGIFTEVEVDGEKEEKPLYLKKVRIDSIYNTFKIKVNKKPTEVGIDPYNKLIDTKSEDNRKELD
jgi:ABC-2 type transport system permease protein